MTITSREYRGEEDFERVRELLIESYAITGRIHNWWLDRWEVFRFSARALDEIADAQSWEKDVRLWETDAGDSQAPRLVGVVNPEDGGDFFLQIHPHYRHIEEEMLAWAEQHHQASRPQDAERWPLDTFLREHDEERAALLTRWGYENLGHDGYTRICSLDKPIPKAPLAPGYVVRNVRGQDDLENRAAVANNAFGHNRHNAETIRVLQRAPTYRQDLDLVVVAPDGTFAAYCVVWFGEANRMGWYEPVGAHPAHRRRGLTKAMMCEGLRRLQALGATVAHVGCGTGEAANRLYESVGFTDFERDFHWRKEF